MKKDNKKISGTDNQADIPESQDKTIETFKPVCKFKKGSMSDAFEGALDAVENMEKKTQH